MKNTMKKSLALICAMFSFTSMADIGGEAGTTITLNDVETRVNFNDGDTFKVLDGVLKQSRARVVGINALENYGPVHEWEGSSSAYLYNTSRRATEIARRGHWTCTVGTEKDGFGRLLAFCDDLAIELIHEGVAHAYSIDEDPADEAYLEQQHFAQSERKGMWKFSVPEFIITSLHSASEGGHETYNRLISTLDGHSEKWFHEEAYHTCQNICLDDGSCMLYVPFGRRYGSAKADCLGHALLANF